MFFRVFIDYMRIYPIKNNNVYFSANNREVYNADNKFQYKTTTYFFRADTDWDALSNYLCQKYADVDKVNVICHACSNGMEPYSFLMHMSAFHPLEIKKLEKFSQCRCSFSRCDLHNGSQCFR